MEHETGNTIERSFTLIEVIVGIALMLIVFLGIFGAYQLGLKVVGQSKARIIAVAVGNQQMEQVRNFSYEKVGTYQCKPEYPSCDPEQDDEIIPGYPRGDIKETFTVSQNNIEYTLNVQIDYVDDPKDGLGVDDNAQGCPEDYRHCVNDYKKVNIRVSWAGRFGGEIFLENIVAPRDCYQECGEKGGVLKVSAFHENGEAVVSPYIEVDNINPDSLYFGLHKEAFPEDGEHYFILPPDTDAYRVRVSKANYSSDQTYGSGEVYQGKTIANPAKPHASILEGQIWPVSFKIDKLSDFFITALEAKAKHIYYVRKSGNDNNDGLSAKCAFLTLQKAAQVMTAGDMVFVGSGDYTEEVIPQNSGTSDDRIIFVADTLGNYTGDTGEVKISNGNFGFNIGAKKYITIYGFKITGTANAAIYVSGSSSNNIEIINNTIFGNLSYGVYVENGSNVAISHNTIYSNFDGIFLENADSSTVIKNMIYQNTHNGIKVMSSGGATIRFNEVFDNQEMGILIYSNSNGCGIAHNVVYSNDIDGIQVSGNCSSIEVLNNKSYSNQEVGIAFKQHISNANKIFSNLVYDNQKAGISLSDNCVNNTISNNTSFQNQEQGILIEGDSNNNEIKDNIITNNTLAGIKIFDSTNINNFYNNVWQNNPDYDGIFADETDISQEPLFVDVDGEDNILGESNGEDDKFYLSHLAAGQSQDSPCIDAGSDLAVNLGMAVQTTRTDEAADTGVVDMGYHYSLEFPPSPPSRPSPFGSEIPNTNFFLLLKIQAGTEAIVGTDASGENIYKYSENHQTDANGYLEILDSEFGSYVFSEFNAVEQDLDLIVSWPSLMPIVLCPDTEQEVKLGLKAENTLLIKVQDGSTANPIFSASVRVYNTDLGYNTTKLTAPDGEAYFIPLEKDWYNLEISAEGYATFTDSVFVNKHTEETVLLTSF